MDLDKIKKLREAEKARQAELAKENEQRRQSEAITKGVVAGASLTTKTVEKSADTVKQELKASGDKVIKALHASQAPVAEALNNLVLATVISKDPAVIDTAKALAALLNEISKASTEFKGSKLNLLPVANEKLATAIDTLAKNVTEKPDKDYSPDLKAIRQQLQKLGDIKIPPPVVNVPETKLDLKAIVDAIDQLKGVVNKQKAPSVSVDMEAVVNGLTKVQDTIGSLSFPVPNYILPFKDPTTGKATQATLAANGSLPVQATIDTTGLATTATDTNTGAISTTVGSKTDAKSTATDGTSVSMMQVMKQISASVQAPPTQAVAGDVASGSADSGNPVKVGGIAKTAEPTSVTDGQRVNALFSKSGKLIVRHSLREMLGNQQTTITSSTSETTIVTADATYLLDLYGLTITNTSSTYTKVTIKDSTAGTTRFVFSVPAQDTRGFMLPASDGHKQATANNNWTATCGTSVSAIEITALFSKHL